MFETPLQDLPVSKRHGIIDSIRRTRKFVVDDSSGSHGSAGTPQVESIALLFIVVDNVPHENVWKEWAAQGEEQGACTNTGLPRVKMYFMPKFPEKIQSPWVRERFVCDSAGNPVTFCPEWGSAEIMDTMRALLRAAYEDTDGLPHDRFVFLSESCVPVVPLRRLHKELVRWPFSMADLRRTPNNGYSALKQFQRVKKLMIPRDCVCKADQWTILTRSHVRSIYELYKHVPEDFWVDAISTSFAPDEMYFSTILTVLGLIRFHTVDIWHKVELSRRCAEGAQTSGLKVLRTRPQALRTGWATTTVQPQGDASTFPYGLEEHVQMLCKFVGGGTKAVYGEVLRNKPTYVNWSASCKHPRAFYGITPNLVARAIQRNCFFARKVILKHQHTAEKDKQLQAWRRIVIGKAQSQIQDNRQDQTQGQGSDKRVESQDHSPGHSQIKQQEHGLNHNQKQHEHQELKVQNHEQKKHQEQGLELQDFKQRRHQSQEYIEPQNIKQKPQDDNQDHNHTQDHNHSHSDNHNHDLDQVEKEEEEETVSQKWLDLNQIYNEDVLTDFGERVWPVEQSWKFCEEKRQERKIMHSIVHSFSAPDLATKRPTV